MSGDEAGLSPPVALTSSEPRCSLLSKPKEWCFRRAETSPASAGGPSSEEECPRASVEPTVPLAVCGPALHLGPGLLWASQLPLLLGPGRSQVQRVRKGVCVRGKWLLLDDR